MAKLTLTGKDIIAIVLVILLGVFIALGRDSILTTLFISTFTTYVIGEKVKVIIDKRRGK